MSFLPAQPCCLEGMELPGTPSGAIEPPSSSRTINRYHARPQNGSVKDEKTAVVLFYDLFGFQIVRLSALISLGADPQQPNAKILADAFAEKLGLDVFVIDFIRVSPICRQYCSSGLTQPTPRNPLGQTRSSRASRTRTRTRAGSRRSGTLRSSFTSSCRTSRSSCLAGPPRCASK